jgi:putative flippase GtrA
MRFFKFGAVGVVNTAITFVVFNLVVLGLDASAVVGNLVGYSVGFANSFWLNRRWTFGDRPDLPVRRTMGRFAIVYLLSLGLSTALVWVLERAFLASSLVDSVSRALALNAIEAVAVLLAFVVNYLLAERWAFGEGSVALQEEE